jgi:outer membrane lipoprotein LolB
LKTPALARIAWLILILLFVNACTGVAVKEPVAGNEAAHQKRAEMLGRVSNWGLVGKISLDDGDRGGSGKLRWNVESESSTLDFHGAMGRGAWHLQTGPDGALLKEADGTQQAALSVDDLVRQRIGWPVPVDALQWWVRGLVAPGVVENEEVGAEGLLQGLEQFGWQVEFSRYRVVEGIPLPRRLNAVRGDYRVKLAIGRWQLDMDHALEN